jgi:hypothetical protein
MTFQKRRYYKRHKYNRKILVSPPRLPAGNVVTCGKPRLAHSYSFIKRLARAYSARSGKSYADCLSLCCRRICFSIRLGVARQLTASKMFLDNLFVDTLNVED